MGSDLLAKGVSPSSHGLTCPETVSTRSANRGGLGVGLIIVKFLNLSGAAIDRRDAMGVAAVRRFADRRLRKPAYPKVSRAQPP